MDEENFTDFREMKGREEIDVKEIEEYFRKRGIDLEAGIARIKAMVERRKREIEEKPKE